MRYLEHAMLFTLGDLTLVLSFQTASAQIPNPICADGPGTCWQYAINFRGTASAQQITAEVIGGCSQPSCGVTPNPGIPITRLSTYPPSGPGAGALAGAGYGYAGPWLYHYGTSQWQWLRQVR